jgi:hypothetical protein
MSPGAWLLNERPVQMTTQRHVPMQKRTDEKVNAILSGFSDLGCHCRDGRMEIKFGAGSTLNRLPMTKSMSVLVDWTSVTRLSYGRLLNSVS